MTNRTKKALVLVIVCVVLNVILALIKLFVGTRTNSLCIMLDSMNGFFDTGTGIVTVIAFYLSGLPKTEKYPYGRGRSEYAAGFIVSVAATVMGGTFFFDSLSRIAMPEPVWFGVESCILISASVLIKLAMALAFHFANKKIKSKAVTAIAMDSFLDVGITTATVISFAVSSQVNYAVDAIFGIVISVVVVVVSIKMIIDNISIITGKPNCEEEKESIVLACKKEQIVTKILKTELHDYGYRACYGTVYIECKQTATQEEIADVKNSLRAFMKEEHGAEITFIVADKSAQ